jgi:hypothetical protein
MTTAVDRRAAGACPQSALRRELNFVQLATLAELSHFGWELKFIRRKPFQAPVAVVFSPDNGRFGVLKADGSLNMESGLELRA